MSAGRTSPFADDGHFESEVRRLAKLIWPAAHVRRSPIVDNYERDAIITTPDIFIVVEATTSRKAEKIRHDGKKPMI